MDELEDIEDNLDTFIWYFLQEYKILLDERDMGLYGFIDKYYQRLNETKLKRLFYDYYEKYDPGGWNIGKTRHLLGVIDTLCDFRTMTPKPNRISVNNGTLCLDGEQRLIESSWDPADDITYHLDFDYNPKAQCPVYDRFIRDIACDDKSLANTFNEVLGYTLSGEGGADKLFVLIGEGANGKSTYMKIIESMLGPDQVAHLPPHKMSEKMFYIHDMRRARANMVYELPSSTTLEELFNDTVKAIVVGDPVQAEIKGGDSYSLKLPTKIIVATNYLPKIKSVPGEAVLRRYLLLPFNASFSGDKVDRDIFRKILEEREGVLKRAVSGYRRLAKNSFRFSYEAESRNRISDAIEAYCPVFVFARDNIVAADGKRITYKVLRSRYTHWRREKCTIEDFMSDEAFSVELKRALSTLGIPYETYKSNGDRGIVGIKFSCGTRKAT